MILRKKESILGSGLFEDLFEHLKMHILLLADYAPFHFALHFPLIAESAQPQLSPASMHQNQRKKERRNGAHAAYFVEYHLHVGSDVGKQLKNPL